VGVTISEGTGLRLYGAAEVARALGCQVSNVGRKKGLPAPVAELDCGRIWLAEQVDAFIADDGAPEPEPEWVARARELRETGGEHGAGLSWAEVSAAVGVPQSTVHRWVTRGA
jgi:hypothetical protein